MARKTTRRNFLSTGAAVGVGFWAAGGIAPRASRAAIDKIHFASVGVAGKGASDSQDAGRNGDMVAICDIDDNSLNNAAKRWPDAKKYNDYRKMFEEMEKSIDAVTVSTPDHCHAVIGAAAISRGKHCFIQKPLAHSIYEVRHLQRIAAEKKVATQMGNQYTADSNLRRAAAIIKEGHIGKVKEVHVWTNRPIWPQGIDRPTDMPPVPSTVHWPEWIGPAEMRPYSAAYHDFKWRGWWAFGTGALGDMACHTVNMPYHALDLRDPSSVHATTSGHNKETYPSWSIIDFQMPARGERPALTFKWYDGGKRPETTEFQKAEELAISRAGEAKAKGLRGTLRSGCFVLGDKGWLLAPGDYAGSGIYMPEPELPKVEFPRSPGHFEEWVNAIKGGEQSMSNFPAYAGPLAETILLGNLAVWAAAGDQDPAKREEQKQKGVVGKKIEWDAKSMTATNAPEVANIVKPIFHNGYKLEG
jgi:predicted dehydrogenase